MIDAGGGQETRYWLMLALKNDLATQYLLTNSPTYLHLPTYLPTYIPTYLQYLVTFRYSSSYSFSLRH